MLARSFLSTTSKRCYSKIVSPRNFKVGSQGPKKTNLVGMTLEEIQQEIIGLEPAKKYTALQIWQHMYKKGHTQFDDMPNLSKDMKQVLNHKYEIDYGEIKVEKKE